MLKIITITIVAIIGLIILFFLVTEGPRLLFSGFSEFQNSESDNLSTNTSTEKGTNEKGVLDEQALLSFGLRTNTTQASIPLDQILSGGPGKDGIPAINNPAFRSVSDALQKEDGEGFGISVNVNNVDRFYPYNILVWHEIVNDEIGGAPVLVTFCPLCGSAIVYSPIIQNERRQFGVSGLLFESNLLMYDTTNESLWSQSRGEAVVGTDTGTKLALINSDVLTLNQFAQQFPSGEVLARPTNFTRNYDFYPYGNYENSDSLVFDVSVEDKRFPAKTLMYVVPVGDVSVAFKRDDLLSEQNVSLTLDNGTTLNATANNGKIEVRDVQNALIPGYTEMWFSWATHHQNNGVVWTQ